MTNATPGKPDHNEQIEKLALEFRNRFGLYAPGKDVAAACGGENVELYKHKFFKYWVESESTLARFESEKAQLVEALEGAQMLPAYREALYVATAKRDKKQCAIIRGQITEVEHDLADALKAVKP